MTHARDHYANWLREAHAMEAQGLVMLDAQSRRLQNYPELKLRMERHAEESRRHLQALEGLLGQLPSRGNFLFKDVAGKVTARFQGLSGIFIPDEVVKTMMAAYAFEHMEIAAYRVLIATADELDEPEARAIFENILEEETAMAAWLAGNLDDTTCLFLMRDERELQAKR